jgi:wyosine [tRNA(Phe)-imidazoG37] synthetase (radical SAM superfamily)
MPVPGEGRVVSSVRGRVYGPVPSRRLGASLGVDVVPLKACSYDCLYCQLGPTRQLTTERSWFFPVEDVVAEVEQRLHRPPAPDVISLAGSGEPTLYAGLGALIDGIKRITDTRVAVLTNGSLFHRGDVRAEVARADLVLPSLDAGDDGTWRLVNRPAAGLGLEQVVDGLVALRRDYRGEIWLEVMIVAGINDTPERVGAIADLARRIAPDRIQLNTPVRPTFDARAVPVPGARLAELAALFTPAAEVIAEWREPAAPAADLAADRGEVLDLLRRRPCTAADVAAGLGRHPNLVIKTLALLEDRGEAHRVVQEGRVFWRAVPGGEGRAAKPRGRGS